MRLRDLWSRGPEIPAAMTMPRWPENTRMHTVDMELIEYMLAGSRSDRAGAVLRFHDYGNDLNLCYTPGGFHLLIGAGHGFLLNIDVAIMFSNDTLIDYRNTIYHIATRMRVPVIPMGETAFHRGPSDNGRLRSSLRHVHSTPAMESVFTLQDGETLKYFLSGYDTQETPSMTQGYRPPGLYFLAQLPHPVRTVDEAREALKPASVKAAEAQGIEVKRQGDLFAIRTEMTREEIGAIGGVFREYQTRAERDLQPSTLGRSGGLTGTSRTWREAVEADASEYLGAAWEGAWTTASYTADRAQITFPPGSFTVRMRADGLREAVMIRDEGPSRPYEPEKPGLYGTAHICTHNATLPNGMWLGSGTMHHDPHIIGDARRPDHKPLVLGDGYWMIIPNAVPKSAGRARMQRW